MMSQVIKNNIEQSVKSLYAELGVVYSQDIAIQIEQPAHIEHGDYSTNIALKLSKPLRKSPMQIANLLKQKLEQEGSVEHLVYRVDVAPPGFINMFIDWGQWAQMEFATPPQSDAKVVVEHTSINPNKSAHIGHLRNSCIGDSIVRMLERTGYQVEVHNYIDDLGNQLADTVVGLMNPAWQAERKEHVRFGDFCWDIYAKVNKQYEQTPHLLEQRANVLHALEAGNNSVAWIGFLAAERIVREHLEEMSEFGIRYDLLVWESSIVREGFWERTFALLQQTPRFYRETSGKLEGCWVLKQSATEIGEEDAEHVADKVLVRSNGILTYTAKDIAYHLWKFGLLEQSFKYKRFSEQLWTTHADGKDAALGKADIVINVIDYRQQYPQAMVREALESLGYGPQAQNLRHVSYGVVSLSPRAASELGIDTSDGKSSYAMSGRQGIGIKVADLLNRMEAVIEHKRADKQGLSSRIIAAAAIRYYLLRFSLLTEVVFDIEQATEITGNTGVYVMYAHARAVSILSKAAAVVQPGAPETIDSGRLEAAEYMLLRQIAAWPDRLQIACEDLSPHLICVYTYELATLFNNFYAACPIMKAEPSKREFRLWITHVFKVTIGDALSVLGLPAPNRM
ncbi:MAG: arginyl-tRNA synthetase [Paenibacillus sp.]|nr:arginyl-tRNA synthetase [Paenibacillus sp.]